MRAQFDIVAVAANAVEAEHGLVTEADASEAAALHVTGDPGC
jgi:hypothetical protein